MKLIMVDNDGAIMQEYGDVSYELDFVAHTLTVVVPNESDITDQNFPFDPNATFGDKYQ
jgi:hypothetical protein